MPDHALTCQALTDCRAVAQAMVERGLATDAAWEKAALLASATALLDPPADLRAFYVPGRIELFGKHTDYAGGRSIIAALDRGICLVARPLEDPTVVVRDARSGLEVRFDLNPDLQPLAGHWSHYPMVVARRVARNFPGPLRGMDAAFASDLPPAAGMSSSSALVVACFLALADINDLVHRAEYRRNISCTEDLAEYLASIENGQSFRSLPGDCGVGTLGGSQDHTAILCSMPGNLSVFSYLPTRQERIIPWPEDLCLVIAVSGVVAEKTAQAMQPYNRASLMARFALDQWNRHTGRQDPHLAAAVRSRRNAPERLREILAGRPDLLRRAEHFLSESEQLVPAAADALAAADWHALGAIAERSQQLAQSLLENQVPQTCFLADCARQLGALASSAFGAGFGGSVWAAVRAGQTQRFISEWSARYCQAFPEQVGRSAFFPGVPGPAAWRICP